MIRRSATLIMINHYVTQQQKSQLYHTENQFWAYFNSM